MDRYSETFQTWNKVAKQYEDKFMNFDLYNETYDFFCNSISKKNASILEIGCGPGNIAHYLMTKRPDFEFFGIDVAPAMIELAAKNNPSAKFSIMDARQINELPMNFDGIISGFCLPYLSDEDTRGLIFNCKNLLNENGLIYMSFVDGEPHKSSYQVGGNGNRVYFYFHALETLKGLLMENGFSECKTFEVDYDKGESGREMHTALIAKKTTV
jgi:cyclopropane fatty-acyl-phospholipid synthase-like methyltransferase